MVLNLQQLPGLSLVLRPRTTQASTARLPLREVLLISTRPHTTAAQPINAQAVSMFASAVSKHSREDALKKSLFPSSSPSAPSQSASHTGNPVSNAFTRQQMTPTSSTLTTSSSIQNRPAPPRSNAASTDPKRTDQTGQGFASTLDRNGFRDEKSVILIEDDSVRQTGISRSNGSVYFDENDFDSDVDLDAESPKIPTKPPAQPASRFVAAGGKNFLATPGSQARNLPTSSGTPIPWSSSPPEHFAAPSRKRSVQAISKDENSNSAISEQMSVNPSTTRAPKRRFLPWPTASNEVGQSRDSRTETTSIEQRFGQDSSAREQSIPTAPKTNADLHLFNQTASTVKKEQKRLRQTNKKMIKDNPATEATKAIAIQDLKRKKPCQVFLSEEQKKVASLVVNHVVTQSVFFTGSAGKM
jgi:ATP-dependent DNA helicase PIF1